MSTQSTTFQAILSPVKTALEFHGLEGIEVKFTIADNDIAGAAKLIMARGKRLKIAVEWED